MARRSYKNKSKVDQQNENDFRKFIEIAAAKMRKKRNLDRLDVLDATNRIKDQLRASFQAKNYTNMDYNDIKLCIGYLQRYAFCHAILTNYETRQFYRKTKASLKKSLLQDNSFKVVSVGGGPGTDILAFCLAIKKMFWNCKDLQLDLTVVDIKRGWEEVFMDIVSTAQRPELASNSIFKFFRKFNPACKFVEADVRKQQVEEIKTADFILLVKVLSSLEDYQRPSILKNIFTTMKPGAVFFYMDTCLGVVVREARNTGLKLLFQKEGKFETSSAQGSYYSISACTYDVCAYRKE